MRLIDADALKETIDREIFRHETIDHVFQIIDDAPTIEPKRGEWIGEADGYYNGELIYDTWYCSNCDYVVDDEEPPTWNFCPNCGADMRGKDDEYERAVEQMEYDMLYEPTYNPEDGSM